jgi:CXXX repeat radical SAM target protein
MDEKEQKRVSRRKFLGESSKTALAGTAAAFLGLGMMATRVEAENCPVCTGTCTGTCKGSCVGCSGTCSGNCAGTCLPDCNGTCSGSPRGITLDVRTGTTCGTPVLQPEISNRHLLA